MSGARRVVTLPPSVAGEAALGFAASARARGAHLLELRTDLHAADVDVAALAQVLPLLVSQRGTALPAAWLSAASHVDVDIVESSSLPAVPSLVASHHAPRELSSAAALKLWAAELPPGALVKHVEPLGAPERLGELLATQQALIQRFGPGRVTVLCMGADALAARAVLAARNALDYVAVGSSWKAAPGQRLLDDAVRAARAPPDTLRRGILGTGIEHSRSPRIHTQPFDRIELPEDAPVERLADALLPHYAGFAVTSPFKQRMARHVGSELAAVNTLVREGDRWRGFNTDVAGARHVLAKLAAPRVTVLGDGGASAALRAVAPELGCELVILRRAQVDAPVAGAAVWTWPDRVEVPPRLRFDGARVVVIAYGAPGRRVAREIEQRGGTPLLWGAAWFIAQARQQREHWENAR